RRSPGVEVDVAPPQPQHVGAGHAAERQPPCPGVAVLVGDRSEPVEVGATSIQPVPLGLPVLQGFAWGPFGSGQCDGVGDVLGHDAVALAAAERLGEAAHRRSYRLDAVGLAVALAAFQHRGDKFFDVARPQLAHGFVAERAYDRQELRLVVPSRRRAQPRLAGEPIFQRFRDGQLAGGEAAVLGDLGAGLSDELAGLAEAVGGLLGLLPLRCARWCGVDARAEASGLGAPDWFGPRGAHRAGVPEYLVASVDGLPALPSVAARLAAARADFERVVGHLAAVAGAGGGHSFSSVVGVCGLLRWGFGISPMSRAWRTH